MIVLLVFDGTELYIPFVESLFEVSGFFGETEVRGFCFVKSPIHESSIIKDGGGGVKRTCFGVVITWFGVVLACFGVVRDLRDDAPEKTGVPIHESSITELVCIYT